MEFVLLGWPETGPTLRLDYRRFAYAGKFVMSNTGKAVAREEGVDDGTAGADGTEGNVRPEGNRGLEGDAGTDEGNDPTNAEFADGVLAAVAFNVDRTDSRAAWLRYVTVREDRKGEAIGPRLCAFVVARLRERFERVKIAVNNPFAYEALHKVGFGFTGEETGVAELVLAYPADGTAGSRTAERYRDGLNRFRERDLSDAERAFLAAREASSPPEAVHEPSRTSGE